MNSKTVHSWECFGHIGKLLLLQLICQLPIFTFFSSSAKKSRFNFLSLFLQIFLVLIFILAVIIYRTLVQIPLFQNKTLRPVAQMIASMSGAMVNLVLIMMLGRVYEKMALKLTTWGKNLKEVIIVWLPVLYWCKNNVKRISFIKMGLMGIFFFH